jgi:hypothetical protein
MGMDISPDGNLPSMSKHDLLNHWPKPTLVQDVASFVGFLQFYSKFIPCFKLQAKPLCKIMKCKYTKPIGNMWTPKVQATFDELQKSILNNPCLCWFDPKKLTVLHTDFLAKGLGYIACQPDDDEVSLELVLQFMSGIGFHLNFSQRKTTAYFTQ